MAAGARRCSRDRARFRYSWGQQGVRRDAGSSSSAINGSSRRVQAISRWCSSCRPDQGGGVGWPPGGRDPGRWRWFWGGRAAAHAQESCGARSALRCYDFTAAAVTVGRSGRGVGRAMCGRRSTASTHDSEVMVAKGFHGRVVAINTMMPGRPCRSAGAWSAGRRQGCSSRSWRAGAPVRSVRHGGRRGSRARDGLMYCCRRRDGTAGADRAAARPALARFDAQVRDAGARRLIGSRRANAPHVRRREPGAATTVGAA